MISLQSSLDGHYEMRSRAYDIDLSIARLAIQKGSRYGFSSYPTQKGGLLFVWDQREGIPPKTPFCVKLVGNEYRKFIKWSEANESRHCQTLQDLVYKA